MRRKVDVRAVHALDELRAGLVQFREEAETALREMEAAIRRVLHYLAEREAHWNREVARREAEHNQALAALTACRSRGSRDPKTRRTYVPPCTREQEWVRRTRVELERAAASLRAVRKRRKVVERTVADYRRQARRLAAHLEANVPKATARLEQHAAALRSYLSIGTAPTAPTSTAPPAPAQTHTAPTEPTEPPAMSEAMPEHIREIPLDRIAWESVGTLAPEDYRKVSREEMREGLRKLIQVVRPKVQQGATAEDFSRMDETLGLDYAHGYRRIYDAFYGESCITLERYGDKYYVINGRHRLLLAREMGIRSLPARVRGEDKPTLSQPPQRALEGLQEAAPAGGEQPAPRQGVQHGSTSGPGAEPAQGPKATETSPAPASSPVPTSGVEGATPAGPQPTQGPQVSPGVGEAQATTPAPANFTPLPQVQVTTSTPTAAARTLFTALMGVAGFKMITWLARGLRRALGATGRGLAARLLQEGVHLQEVPLAPPKHGFDRVFIAPGLPVIVLESRVHPRGMSELAALVRERGFENEPVVAMVIESETGRASVYYRAAGSETWQILREGVSLTEALKEAQQRSGHPPGPGGVEREPGPERLEGGPGGAEFRG